MSLLDQHLPRQILISCQMALRPVSHPLFFGGQRASQISATLPPIDPGLAESLSAKSDQELLAILENAADWRPEVVDFARSELRQRSVSPVYIDRKLSERVEEVRERSNEPLSLWESLFTALYGAGLGLLLGLFFQWRQASQFESDGYILKSRKSWRLYWFALGIRLAVILVVVVILVFL